MRQKKKVSEYIERAKAIESTCKYCQVKDNCSNECAEVADLKAIPTADVQEVKHGKWEEVRIIRTNKQTSYTNINHSCSLCKYLNKKVRDGTISIARTVEQEWTVVKLMRTVKLSREELIRRIKTDGALVVGMRNAYVLHCQIFQIVSNRYGSPIVIQRRTDGSLVSFEEDRDADSQTP